MSFILKSSAFADALSEAGIEIDTQMIYGAGGIFFDAHFWAPNENVGYERLYVRVGAVSNNVAAAARRYVEHSVLPELIAWIAELLALPRNSPLRRQQQYFVRHQPEHFIP